MSHPSESEEIRPMGLASFRSCLQHLEQKNVDSTSGGFAVVWNRHAEYFILQIVEVSVACLCTTPVVMLVMYNGARAC